ncbi:MAG: hypothetical protein AB1411_03235 [Nitrospirota bacterium]
MRTWLILGALVACSSMLAAPAQAEDKTLEERIKKLEQQLQEMREFEEKEREREKMREPAPPLPEGKKPTGTGPIPEIARERAGEEKVPLSFASTGSGRLLYAKPFLSAPKATVGGYADIQFNALSRSNLDNRSRNTFNQVRMIPFIYSDITDRIKFATEIEFERGGPNNNQSDGEIKLEFAQIDYLINEAANVRAGLILVPMGKFNLLHDSPLNDLVDRPMVARMIMPSTWTEAGAGMYGTFYPGKLAKVDYELYVINGLQNTSSGTLAAPGTVITDLNGTRNARGSFARDANSDKAIVGRLAYSPLLGIEVAGSFYHGLLGNRNSNGVNNFDSYVNMYAVDWTLQKGPWEFIGEAHWVRITGNQTATAVGPSGMAGYYVQANYHFLPDFLKKLAPDHFTDASTFTAVVRWEQIDTDTTDITRNSCLAGITTGSACPGNARELSRLTIGLNFRPIEDTVFKFEYQFNNQLNTSINNYATNTPTSTARGNRVDGNGFMAMAATYF